MKKWLIRFLKLFIALLIIFTSVVIYVYYQYSDYFTIPKTRLGLKDFYSVVPPDKTHIYIELPIDHNNPQLGKYKGFYILSPNFDPGKDIVFYLTDGQQNKVHPEVDMNFQFEYLKNLSYVVIGRRGHYPTLFPEVYNNDGSLDYKKAMALYGTAQQIEDIEFVRQDLYNKRYLAKDGKIMLYGRSGAGVLLQQYIAKYPEKVSRALIEASGGPDIAVKNSISFCNFNEQMKNSNPETIKKLNEILKNNKIDGKALCYILFKLPYFNINGKELRIKLINEIYENNFTSYNKYWWNPENNFYFMKLMMQLPMMEATKIRMFEIAGVSLVNYQKNSTEINLDCEWEKEILKDYLDKLSEGSIQMPDMNLMNERSKYTGEVLVLSATEDQVMPHKLGELTARAYSKSKFALFKDTHAFITDKQYYYDIRKAFFIKGLYSKELQDLLSDPRQLYK